MYLPPQKINPKNQTQKITENLQSITNPLQIFLEIYFDHLCTTQRGNSLAPIHQQINFKPFTSNPGHNPPKAPNHPPLRPLSLTRLFREHLYTLAHMRLRFRS